MSIGDITPRRRVRLAFVFAALAPRYASSNRYVATTASIVEKYDLDRWDHLILKIPSDDHLIEGVPVAMASDRND